MHPFPRENLQRIARATLDFGAPVPYEEAVAAATESVYGSVLRAALRGDLSYTEEVRTGGVCRGGLTPFIIHDVILRLTVAFPDVAIRYVYEGGGRRLLEICWS